MARESLLKVLLRRRHLQTHAAFTAAYEKTARELDHDLIGTAPGREQLQRWLGAKVKTTPRTHHCRVLERMFPDYRAYELLAPYAQSAALEPDFRSTPAQPAEPSDAQDTEETSAPRRTEQLPSGIDQTPPMQEAGARIGDSTIGPLTLDLVWHGADQLEQVLDGATVSGDRLIHLQTEADRLGVQVIRMPPSTLLESSLMHLRGVRSLLAERQPITAARELARIAAKLATVVAEILWNENQLALATRWYHAAIRSATEAGDDNLADLAFAGSTYIPAYTRHPRTVLANVDPRLSAATSSRPASPAIAWLWAFKARAHASLGEANAFEHAVGNARETLEQVPDALIEPGIFSFVPEKLSFYEAHGRVELGDWRGAIQAAESALAGYDPHETTEPTLTRLELATAVAQSGDLAEACELASRALLDPCSYHSTSVVLQARAFDRRLGPTTRTTVRWREFLSGIHPPDAATLARSV